MNVKPKVVIILIIVMITALSVQLFRGGVVLKFFSVDQVIDSDLKTSESSVVPDNYKKILVLNSKEDLGSVFIYENLERVLTMTKQNFNCLSIDSDEVEQTVKELDGDDLLVIATENIDKLKEPSIIKDYIENGGKVAFLIRSLYKDFDEIVGIKENNGFLENDIYGIEFNKRFFPSLDELKITSQKIPHSILDVKISDDTEVVASTAGVPLIWTHKYGSGKVIYVNSTMLMDKGNRGVLINTLSYIDDYFVSTVFNGKIVDIDDFPAPIKRGKDETIFEQYHMTNRSFYRLIWWSSMNNLASRYDLKYTGLIIGTYNLETVSPLPEFNNFAIDDLEYFGRKLFESRGELGIHGYNHNSLALEEEMNFDKYGYNPWESTETMEEGLTLVKDFIDKYYGDIKIYTYVAPSNVISKAGKIAVKNIFPDLLVYAGIYTGNDEESLLLQEFGKDKDVSGTYDFPRLSAGYLYSDGLMWDIYNGIAHYGIVNHFIHPDDLLDPERSQGTKWKDLDKNINRIFSSIHNNFSFLRDMTNKEAIDEFISQENLKVYVNKEENVINIFYENFVNPVYHYLYMKDEKIKFVEGGEFILIDEELGLYLIEGNEMSIKILLK